MSPEAWLAAHVETWFERRSRVRVLELRLRMIMGDHRGRMAVWACRFVSLAPGQPPYESVLRACEAMALAGWFGAP